jgi:hypothetical protein
VDLDVAEQAGRIARDGGIRAGSWPAACSAARIVTPSASSWSSWSRSKRPASALLPRKVLLKRTPSSSAKPTSSR